MPFWISLLISVSWRTGLAISEAAVMKATNSPGVMLSSSAGDIASHTSTASDTAISSWITGVLIALVRASFIFC